MVSSTADQQDIIDIHVHMVGMDCHKGNFIHPDLRRRIFFRYLSRKMGIPSDAIEGSVAPLYAGKTLELIKDSCVDRAVLLALDKAYEMSGATSSKTTIATSNDYIANLVTGKENVLLGASIHPYRPDAVEELERLVSRGACLVKWIPSVQNIQPDHDKCTPFYEAMAYYRIPLLTHTGKEHALPGGDQSLNDPRRFKKALALGVSVIGAHCGARMFLHERSYFPEWKKMALDYEGFYGDISAFIVPTREGFLLDLLKDPELTSKVIFGSDFPVLPMPLSFICRLGIKEVVKLRKEKNPFDQSIMTLKKFGVPDAVFTRAASILLL